MPKLTPSKVILLYVERLFDNLRIWGCWKLQLEKLLLITVWKFPCLVIFSTLLLDRGTMWGNGFIGLLVMSFYRVEALGRDYWLFNDGSLRVIFNLHIHKPERLDIWWTPVYDFWAQIVETHLIVLFTLLVVSYGGLLESVHHVHTNRDPLWLAVNWFGLWARPTFALKLMCILSRKLLDFNLFELLWHPDLQVVILSALAHQQIGMNALRLL